jgi:hypothetical protein
MWRMRLGISAASCADPVRRIIGVAKTAMPQPVRCRAQGQAAGQAIIPKRARHFADAIRA